MAGAMIPVVRKIFTDKAQGPDPPAEMFNVADPEFVKKGVHEQQESLAEERKEDKDDPDAEAGHDILFGLGVPMLKRERYGFNNGQDDKRRNSTQDDVGIDRHKKCFLKPIIVPAGPSIDYRRHGRSFRRNCE
jgi:hypothetical protein